MKSYKHLLNEWAKTTDLMHEMTQTEMDSLRKILIEMYIDISELCKKNNLAVMLGGGSCLGAIRHQGFIPWDDDLDLNMLRPDYEKLIQLLKEGALVEKYEFRYPDGMNDCSCNFLKIYRKDTKMVSFSSIKGDYPKGIYIDVFPIEGVSSHWVIRKFKGFIADSLRLIGNCVAWEERNVKTFEKSMCSHLELKDILRKRKIVGRIFSFAPYRKWAYWYDRFVANDDMSGLVGAPAGRKFYNGEVHDHSVFFPVSKAIFENIVVSVPGKTEEYLIRLYGNNFMQLPPEDKRERHFVVEFKL